MKCLNINNTILTMACDNDCKILAVGGRDILKLVEYTSDNLRYYKSLKNRNISKFQTTFIDWNPIQNNYIAAATQMGQFYVIDINNQNQKFLEFNEHSQVVNKVSWNLQNPDIILSASHEGTIKLWDIRTNHSQTTIQKNESVRDIKYNPLNGNNLCAAYESGALEIFDQRKLNFSLLQRKSAHNKTILTLDWNPFKNNILATGSMDKEIKVWNILGPEIVETHKIQNLAGVSLIKWRPDEPQQLGIASFNKDHTVSIWDLKNSYRPQLVVKGHTDVITGIIFNRKDNRIITASKDQYIISQDINQASKPFESCVKSSIQFDKDDNLAFCTEYNKSRNWVRDVQIINTVNNNLQNNDLQTDLKYFAQNYQTKGDNLKEIVEHNIKLVAHLPKIQQIWKQVYVIIENYLNKMNEQQTQNLLESQQGDKIDINQLYEYFSQNPGQLTQEINKESIINQNGTVYIKKSQIEAFNYMIINRKQIKSQDQSLDSEQIQKSVVDIVQNLIDEGELQHGFFIYFSFQNYIKFPDQLAELWSSNYIQLLRSHKLYCLQNNFIQKSNLISIKYPQNNVIFHTVCMKCKKEIEFGNNCLKCQQQVRCSICERPLTGLITWCQICGHGFHLKEAREYFKQKNKECPQACGHRCFYFD